MKRARFSQNLSDLQAFQFFFYLVCPIFVERKIAACSGPFSKMGIAILKQYLLIDDERGKSY